MTRSPYLARLFPGLLLLTLLSAAVFGSVPHVARADVGLPPVVFTVVPGPDVIANNGACSLREALINANNNNQSGSTDCPAGQADTTDTISLQAGQTYTLTIDAFNNDTDSAAEGDLDILDNPAALDLRIVSNGTERATIAFDQLPNQRNRVLDVHSGAGVLLRGIAITGGRCPLKGGGIQNNGMLTVENGEVFNNFGSSGESNGGGIYTGPGSILSIRQNSEVHNNESYGLGGGIYNNGGSVTVEASMIASNSTLGIGGGGIASTGSANNPAKLTITAGSTVRDNFTNRLNGNSNGGGIWNDSESTVIIDQSAIIKGNTAQGDGGGIVNMADGTITIASSALHDNQSGGGANPNKVLSGDGGAVWNAGLVIVQTSAVYDNKTGKAKSYGGAFTNYGTLWIFNSAVYGNQTQPGSGGSGGAIYNNKTLLVINSTISGNSADGRGGAIATSDGSADIRHATITANTATAAHGGLYLDENFPEIQIRHSILAGNTAAGTPADCDNQSATLTSLGYNLVGNDCGGAFGPNTNDLVGVDPKLAALADNDGPTKTHALQLGSPALNAIPKAACADKEWPQLITDQRGIARPQGAGCEIGAYEKLLDKADPNPTPVLTSLAPDNVAQGSDNVVLTVTGEKFIQGTLVRWNGSNRATTFVSATEVKATILKADLAAAGTAQITAFNPAPAGGSSNALTFVITAPDKQNQTITFAPIADRTLVEGAFTLSATASSGLPVSYSASGACAVAAGEVTLLDSGTCLITAGQPGDDTFNPAPDVVQSFEVTGERVFLPLVVR